MIMLYSVRQGLARFFFMIIIIDTNTKQQCAEFHTLQASIIVETDIIKDTCSEPKVRVLEHNTSDGVNP